MTSKKVSALKFVGTVSVGLLTGVSYTLSTLAAPALLTLPSATTASKTLTSLSSSSATHLTTLSALSSSAFALAFVLSPRSSRHPYLLYTSLLAAASAFAPRLAPFLLGRPSTRPAAPAPAASSSPQRRRPQRSMEASYEVLGDAHSDGTVSGEEVEEDQAAQQQQQQNGEEVRAQVETFLKERLVQTSLAALSFAISIVGIWGDGASEVIRGETIVFGL
ncbi:Uncharacterized protein SAPIO_CDS3089 [Scedosporium apiospermum]|uniref:Autophagy-related protein 33 n=1 Tax=Pseudallescheria apiosperma TaxID=563466 RepID=A0A084GA03_PSEDA|nr:Uncharacterized protein SAPIO_CDS3089 [Scedosporium apiospermum]KEZ44165.1 Uncharacterized protein SAPIO_CDS3089 [Scedosporium apiospermum]